MDPNAMLGAVPQKQQEELMKAIDQMQVRDRYVSYAFKSVKCKSGRLIH
jgi:hypothetical protein